MKLSTAQSGLSRRHLLMGLGAAAAATALPRRRARTSIAHAASVRSGVRRSPNVLFIGVDDLRCDLGCYGASHIRSPHLDALAERGTLFTDAYVQQPVCAASRASLLTGCRPETTTVDYPYNDYFTGQFLADHPTIPWMYHQNGYYTRGLGKIHHGPPLELSRLSEPFFGGGNRQWRPDGVVPATPNTLGPSWGDPDIDDDELADGRIARETVATLERAAGQDKPFFLAVGIIKPHLPFVAPKRYWDLYRPEDLPETRVPLSPEGAPGYATASFELPQYDEGYLKPDVPITPEVARRLRHGYFACVSYIDAQVGRILSALDRLGLREDTLIMFWSDHGFHLGDQGAWGKHMVYDYSSRAPLIVAGPGLPRGQRSEALVEYVDMYPALCELSGIAKPDHLEGTSFVPLLHEPGRAWKSAAFTQYPRGQGLEGYSVRTRTHRYVEWRRNDEPPMSRELYAIAEHGDEAKNLADSQPEVARKLSGVLASGWRAALPPG